MHPGQLPGFSARLLAGAGLLVALAAPACASSASVSFPVNITLSSPGGGGAPAQPGIDPPAAGSCVNQALSQAAGATVTVVCTTNQFVSIAPPSEMSFIGTHGGAFRYMLTADATLAHDDDPLWQAGTGTITTLQILRNKRSQWDITEIQISY